MQIHQLREERIRLEQLVERATFGKELPSPEKVMVYGLWRTARHHPLNSRLEADQNVRLITSGWAGWLRYSGDGRRLIFLFLMPGDFIVPSLFSVHDCHLISLTALRTVDASALAGDGGLCPQISEIIRDSGQRYRLLLLDHMTRLLLGSATTGVSLLLSELHDRSVRSGACVAGRFSLPIGQRVLAAALGRSAVQVNKVISTLQADGLIRVGYNWVEVINPARLRSLSRSTTNDAAAPRHRADPTTRDKKRNVTLLEPTSSTFEKIRIMS